MPRPTRRRFLRTAALAGLAGGALRAAEPGGERLVIEPATVWQPKFRGWGTSLAWWARMAGGFPDEIRGDLMRRIFDPAEGLGLNIVRYNIGGGENPQHHFLSHRAAVEGFQPQPGEWAWDRDTNQRKILLECRRMGVDVFEAFSNSPPWWMTKSGSVTGDKDGRGNLRDDMIDRFADYLARVVAHYRDKAGLSFQTLAPLNEPLGFWWKLGGKQEGCVIPPEQQAKLIVATRQALDARGLPTAVTGPETNRTSYALKALAGYDRAAWRALSHVNTHTYHAENRRQLRELADKQDKDIWMSEYGDGDPSGAKLAVTILGDLRELRAAGWVYWQAIDAHGWGLIHHDAFRHRDRPPSDEEIADYRPNPKFHLMRLFTTHLRPGCRIVSSSLPGSVAAIDPNSRQLSAIVHHPGDQARRCTLELPQEWLKGRTLIATLLPIGKEPQELPPVTCQGTTESFTQPPNSLLAFRIL